MRSQIPVDRRTPGLVQGVKAGLSLVALSPEPTAPKIMSGQECYDSSGAKVTGTFEGYSKTILPVDEELGTENDDNVACTASTSCVNNDTGGTPTKGTYDLKIVADANVNRELTITPDANLDLSLYWVKGICYLIFDAKVSSVANSPYLRGIKLTDGAAKTLQLLVYAATVLNFTTSWATYMVPMRFTTITAGFDISDVDTITYYLNSTQSIDIYIDWNRFEVLART